MMSLLNVQNYVVVEEISHIAWYETLLGILLQFNHYKLYNIVKPKVYRSW